MLKFMSCLVLIAFLSSCQNSAEVKNTIPVVGLDSSGKSQIKYVPTEIFHQQMSPFVGGMSREVSATLENYVETESMPWTLSRVTVGLSLEADFNLFEVVEANGHGSIELRFQKIN